MSSVERNTVSVSGSFAPFSIKPRSVHTSLVFASRDGRLSHPSLYQLPTCYYRVATPPESDYRVITLGKAESRNNDMTSFGRHLT